jgi:molybdenum cofactor cytidylyltransferase
MAESHVGALYGVVLAAGRGSRFGGGKLHASFRDRPLLSHVLDVVRAACDRRILQHAVVVVAADDPRALPLVEAAGLEPVFNDAPQLGLSHSLRLALRAVTSRCDSDPGALMVFLGDQPLVRLEAVAALRETSILYPGRVVRPVYRDAPDVPGHPVVLDRSVWPLLEQIEGDRGYGGEGVTIQLEGRNPDVNTPRDLRVLEDSDGAQVRPMAGESWRPG